MRMAGDIKDLVNLNRYNLKSPQGNKFIYTPRSVFESYTVIQFFLEKLRFLWFFWQKERSTTFLKGLSGEI
jgi:hypothetical protein